MQRQGAHGLKATNHGEADLGSTASRRRGGHRLNRFAGFLQVGATMALAGLQMAAFGPLVPRINEHVTGLVLGQDLAESFSVKCGGWSCG